MKHDVDRGALSRVIAVINGKGGVFKTSLVANVGGLLAEAGSRVLLVDLDPQGNLAEDLGYSDQADGGRSLAAALCFGAEPTLLSSMRPNLDVIAGGPELDDAAAFLGAKAQKDRDAAHLALAKMLAGIAGEYDLVLLDCPPGNEPLQAAAVAAARYALVPLKTDMSSRKGVAAVAARMDSVVGLNPSLDLLGVVLVGTGTNAKQVHKVTRDHLIADFGTDQVLFPMSIRHAEATAQACRERGLLAHELERELNKAPKWWEIRRGEAKATNAGPKSASSVAEDLHAVAMEVTRRIAATESQEVSA
ncbi:ParA family protein [Pseudarthrobacter sp. NPDC092424]|uniref:ParA family protein n=1 Tax=Pseudarthrobacter sp. NPDC092424 TaxID=3364415 RepID=UPI00381E9FFB